MSEWNNEDNEDKSAVQTKETLKETQTELKQK